MRDVAGAIEWLRGMRRLLVIGIGAGDPEHVTAQAIRALNAVDVFFVVEKGEEKHDLVDLRREICERYIESPSYRTVEMRDPERDRSSPAYGEAVEAWRHARAELWEAAIRAELGEDECGAIMVWGDPSLYDSTLAMIEEIVAGGELELDYEVVPGISSVQALAARHRIALNRIGRPIADHDRPAALGGPARRRRRHRRHARRRLRVPALRRQPVDIYWGAYLGTPDEMLVAGDARRGGRRDRARARRGARAQGLDHGHLPAPPAIVQPG